MEENKEDLNIKEYSFDMESKITDIFFNLGIPANIIGYQYLKDAIVMVLNDRKLIKKMTTIVYPNISEKYDTTVAAVERAIRYAIEIVYSKEQTEIMKNIFGNTISSNTGKISNSQFIAVIVERLLAI